VGSAEPARYREHTRECVPESIQRYALLADRMAGGQLMRAILRGLQLLLVITSLCAPAAGEPLERDAVPEPLAPWVDWVLRGHEAERCPFFQGQAEQRACVWPSRLELELGDDRGRFTQEWWVHHETLVTLPGDARRWPQDVQAGGAPLPVVDRGGRPSARLPAGRHALSGSFEWDALPELLQIPPETGMVRLRLRGRDVPFPNRDAQGRLWLQKRSREESGEERLDLRVHRRLVDDIPLQLETRIELQVAGQSREAVLGSALPDGFVPLSLSSPLPARLDPDGRLRVQLRPGRHRIAIEARHEGPAASVAPPDPGGPWADSEVWVFEARPHLRLVTVEDGVAVDPTQTTLPTEWRQLPAYLMKPGRALRLVEKRRGDADPAPDRLTLSRVWWLDFDGAGYTLRDSIQGVVRRSTRLEMGAGTDLGRVALGGRDQLITRLDDSVLSGVEVPQGPIELVADSRIPSKGSGLVSRQLPAVGWDQDFQQLEGRLQLPPGWRLLHATGVDRAAPSWVARWTLLDLFAVLVLAAAFFRLWGLRWGALALLGLALSWTEPRAPHWAWATVLAGEALRRVLPEGRFPRFSRAVWMGHAVALVALILFALPFAVRQVRSGLYPALERPGVQLEFESGVREELDYLADEPASAPVMLRKSEQVLRESFEDAEAPAEPARRRHRAYQPDPNAKITTGPGLPSWQWKSVRLSWSGPVEREQTLRLLLLPPLANGLLAMLRVALLAALLLCTLGALPRRPAGLLRPAALGLLLLSCLTPAATRADLPTPQLLDELRRRLLEKPECLPHCASSPRLALDVRPDSLRARVEVHAQTDVAVPLPGGARSWTPERVLVDGEPAVGLLRDPSGTLWIELREGRHQLVAEGALAQRDSIELPLPLRPHRVEVRSQGWTVHGVHEDGLAEGNLQLVRSVAVRDDARRALEPGELPPFVRLDRSLVLGLEWQVTTQVTRLSPVDTALLMEVPLLPGESVTTPGIRVRNESALISMGPGIAHLRWRSALEQRPRLVLRADEGLPAAESWHLDVSPVWHVDIEGIPPVHQPSQGGARTREWRPWPGEQLVLQVRRPEGVAGGTATIDASQLTLSPGLRATDATLALTLRSSRGGPHAITLPEEAELQRVVIDGADQPIRQEAREVRIPLRPGRQQIELGWREPRGARQLAYRSSEVDLGMPSVNAEIHVQPSAGRWLLWVAGPRLGPAVLFWPLLAVFAGVAFGLGRLSLVSGITPLRFHHWLLLGVGLSQVPVPAAALVVAWLLALGWRKRRGPELPGRWFDLLQLALAGLTLMALVILFVAIQQGLLGTPQMQIAGNGSSQGLLRWYQDRAGSLLPQPWLLSVPLLVYRLAMLAWALWLAMALVGWLRWAWSCFSADEIWRPLRHSKVAPQGPSTDA
jgi:hypothetical protein